MVGNNRRGAEDGFYEKGDAGYMCRLGDNL